MRKDKDAFGIYERKATQHRQTCNRPIGRQLQGRGVCVAWRPLTVAFTALVHPHGYVTIPRQRIKDMAVRSFIAQRVKTVATQAADQKHCGSRRTSARLGDDNSIERSVHRNSLVECVKIRVGLEWHRYQSRAHSQCDAVPNDRQVQPFTGPQSLAYSAEFCCRGNWLAIGGHDLISGTKSGVAPGTSLIHALDGDARVEILDGQANKRTSGKLLRNSKIEWASEEQQKTNGFQKTSQCGLVLLTWRLKQHSKNRQSPRCTTASSALALPIMRPDYEERTAICDEPCNAGDRRTDRIGSRR